MFQENSIATCILSRVKQITSPGWMHETSAWTWCTGKTQRDRVEREVGGWIRMGNTCKSMADSFQCMTKPTTKQTNKNNNKKKTQRIQSWKALEDLGCGQYLIHIPAVYTQTIESLLVANYFKNYNSNTTFSIESVSHSVISDCLSPHGLQPIRLLCPWNSPGNNIGVGCHFLLQGIFPSQGSNTALPQCRETLTFSIRLP